MLPAIAATVGSHALTARAGFCNTVALYRGTATAGVATCSGITAGTGGWLIFVIIILGASGG